MEKIISEKDIQEIIADELLRHSELITDLKDERDRDVIVITLSKRIWDAL